jgi:heme oxygenase (biliverdin-IX-beta and delta-forming)
MRHPGNRPAPSKLQSVHFDGQDLSLALHSSCRNRGRHLRHLMTEGFVKAAIGPVHRLLRNATRNDHAAIDRLLLPFDLNVPRDYQVFLRVHFLAISAQRKFWRAADCADFEQMLHCLEADLRCLGAPELLPYEVSSHPPSTDDALGIAYVVRGSRLGAAVLRRGVSRALPTAYFDFAPALSWREFLGQLEAFAHDPDGAQGAIRGAQRAFAAFSAAFAQNIATNFGLRR